MGYRPTFKPQRKRERENLQTAMMSPVNCAWLARSGKGGGQTSFGIGISSSGKEKNPYVQKERGGGGKKTEGANLRRGGGERFSVKSSLEKTNLSKTLTRDVNGYA